jgi:two-component system chemotaxis response regulator CheB
MAYVKGVLALPFTNRSQSGAATGPYRVMLVDDSAVVRGMQARILEKDPDIAVVASVGNGQAALNALDRQDDVEVVVLDIEMPVMDGLTALPKILEKKPNVRVIMASTLTKKNADISLRALSAGAADYIPKPAASKDLSTGDFAQDLPEKVKALGASGRGGRSAHPAAIAPVTGRAFSAQVSRAKVAENKPMPGGLKPAAAPRATPAFQSARAPLAGAAKTVTLRPAKAMPERAEVLAIGSSTGGPQALFAVFEELKKGGKLNVPVLVTQHMPATFTTILAEHISKVAGMDAIEAQDGMEIEPGKIYVARGDYHMLVELKGRQKVLKLTQDAPENFCRPAVDPMFRSIARCFGRKVLAVVLTGMGSDGALGGTVVADAGGTVIAQDEASSVVWGMPGATAQAGACTAVLPLGEIPAYIRQHIR